MKYIKYLFLLSFVNSEKISIPSCKKCIYYKPSPYNFDFNANYNRCTKFGEKDIVMDKINYDFAELCRNDESKCGKQGKYFEEEQNLNMKLFVHKVIYIFTITSPLSIIIFVYLYLILIIKKLNKNNLKQY
jgi:hypothetical protein